MPIKETDTCRTYVCPKLQNPGCAEIRISGQQRLEYRRIVGELLHREPRGAPR